MTDFRTYDREYSQRIRTRDAVECNEPDPDGRGQRCTRPKGHDGEHVALGVREICGRWSP